MEKLLGFFGLDTQGRKEVFEGFLIVVALGAVFGSVFLLMVNVVGGVICLLISLMFGKMILSRDVR